MATLGPHVKLPTEMSNFPTLGGPPGANVKLSKGSVKVYAWLGPYYPPHHTTRDAGVGASPSATSGNPVMAFTVPPRCEGDADADGGCADAFTVQRLTQPS